MSSLRYLLPAATIACTGLTSPAFAETTYKVNCEYAGDIVLVSATGEAILEQRLAGFTALEPYENATGPNGGQRAICTIKNDPPGFKWLECGKRNGKYIVYTQPEGGGKVVKPIKAIPNRAQYLAWSGACLIKL